MQTRLINTADYLLLIDEEAEIKQNSYFLLGEKHINIYKGEKETKYKTELSQPIIAYYPLTKEAKELDLPLLPDPIKEKSIDSFATELAEKKFPLPDREYYDSWQRRNGFIEGYKTAQSHSKQFSLEDMKKAIEMAREFYNSMGNGDSKWTYDEDQIIQLLSTQQLLPKDFILGEGTTIEEQIKNGHYTW